VSAAAGVPPEVDTLVARAAGANAGHSRTAAPRAEPLRAARHGLAAYAARRIVVHHLRTRHPEYAHFTLKPEPHLTPHPPRRHRRPSTAAIATG
jgi:hypothetical protein